MVRVIRIELIISIWKIEVIPFNYTRFITINFKFYFISIAIMVTIVMVMMIAIVATWVLPN